MNTFTKLNTKTLIQLFATAMIALTLLSCVNGDVDTIAANASRVSTLSAHATGKLNEVTISWNAVQGAHGYRLYQTTADLSNSQSMDPNNLSMPTPAAIFTVHTTNHTTIDLGGTQTVYFLVTVIENTVESYTNAKQTVANAFATEFLTVVSTGTGPDSSGTPTNRVWMDKNLGASRAATGSMDTLAYGDLYQWGRSRDGHQIRTSDQNGIQVNSITPDNGEFITNGANRDWTLDGVDNNGTLRNAYWSRIDGSGICPTGFRVPTKDELLAEFNSWSSRTSAGAFASNLKLSVTGLRYNSDATIVNYGTRGYIWSSTAVNNVGDVGDYAFSISLQKTFDNTSRAYGIPVRCIRD